MKLSSAHIIMESGFLFTQCKWQAAAGTYVGEQGKV